MPIIANGRYNKLTAIKVVGTAKDGHKIWLCECDCGNTTRVSTNNLITGQTKSCGCAVIDHLRSDEMRKAVSRYQQGRPKSKAQLDKFRATRKGKPATPAQLKHLQTKAWKYGKDHPNWREDKVHRYCHKFNERVREQVREKFGRRCVMPLCGMTEVENGAKLDVHHTDYNKMQGCGVRGWTLVPLCHGHHTMTTNSNRWYWFSVLYNLWAMNTDIHLNRIGDN